MIVGPSINEIGKKQKIRLTKLLNKKIFLILDIFRLTTLCTVHQKMI